jgi:hypothetical protein
VRRLVHLAQNFWHQQTPEEISRIPIDERDEPIAWRLEITPRHIVEQRRMSKSGACPVVLPGDDDLDAIRRKLRIHGGDEFVDSLRRYAGRT